MRAKLDMQVAAAVGAMIVGRDSITLDEVAASLPAHIRAASPSLKAMTKALTSAGWVGVRHDGGQIVYVPPGSDDEAEEPGHNASVGGAGDEVRLLIERAERLMEEKKGIGDDIKDVFAVAKSRGHDPVALREIIRLRAQKPEDRQSRQAVLEVYLRAMGMMA